MTYGLTYFEDFTNTNVHVDMLTVTSTSNHDTDKYEHVQTKNTLS